MKNKKILAEKEKITVDKSILALLLLAFVVQAWVVYCLLQQLMLYALLLHIVSATIFPWPLWQTMPVRYRKDRPILILLFLMCLLIPLVSGLGLLLSLSISSYYAKPVFKDLADTVQTPKLPENLVQIVQFSQYGGSSLFGLLEASAAEEQRIKAVLKTRQMTDQEAIPILRVALLDPLDEVRLLAYSMLDKKEKNIDKEIHAQLQAMDNSVKEKYLLGHLKLAESYWELSYLGLVQGQAKMHILQDAYTHIKQVLDDRPDDAEIWFLQARIALELELYDIAERSLLQALQLGMNKARVAPYQAELAFVRRRFDEIADFVASVDDTARNNELVSGMIEQWG
jgi:polysaccharide biosynthesis protein PelE